MQSVISEAISKILATTIQQGTKLPAAPVNCTHQGPIQDCNPTVYLSDHDPALREDSNLDDEGYGLLDFSDDGWNQTYQLLYQIFGRCIIGCSEVCFQGVSIGCNLTQTFVALPLESR